MVRKVCSEPMCTRDDGREGTHVHRPRPSAAPAAAAASAPAAAVQVNCKRKSGCTKNEGHVGACKIQRL